MNKQLPTELQALKDNGITVERYSSDTPRPIGRGFLDRSKNLPASTRLP